MCLLATGAMAEPPVLWDQVDPPVKAEADLRLGFVPPNFSTTHYAAAAARNLRGDKALPTRYDARTLGYVSPVKNQGACGACYAFGSAADIESRLLVDGAGLYDVSENAIKECHYLGSSCEGGNQFMTMSYLTRTGVTLEACDPYSATNTACAVCQRPFVVTDWCAVSGSSVPDPSVIKQYLMDYGPLHTSVFAGDTSNPAFSSQFNTYTGGTLYYTGTNTPNHSVFLVGWDDDIVHAGGTGAWIVKNSWGTNWGSTCDYGVSRGYFYIAYGSASIGMYTSFVKEYMVADDSFSTLSRDEAGYSGALGGGTTFWGLVSLDVPDDGYLHRVEFFTTDRTTDVDVFVYGAFNGTSLSNQLASDLDNSYDEPGYHYAQLAAPVALTAGQTLYLAVKFVNESYSYPLAVDGDGPVNTGKSYYSFTGSTWSSLASYDADVTIRARVGTGTALSVEDPADDPAAGAGLPRDLRLDTAWPNPFNPTTNISYSLPWPGQVRLTVHDLKGARVRTLVNEHRPAGNWTVLWDGTDDRGGRVPSGVYFCRVGAGDESRGLKLVLLK